LRLARVVLLLGALLGSGAAFAFGPLGHQTVAEIASRGLNPHARAEVERLLGDRASNAMRDASTWADDLVNKGGHKELRPLHYVNYPRDSCYYDARRDCRDGRCAEAALVRFAKVLATSHDDAERVEALKWVIHLVADVHQPLHAGYKDDRGGNDRQLQLLRKPTNLHAIWDSGMIQMRGRRAVPYADWLISTPAPPVDAAWSPEAPAHWLDESCALIGRFGIYDTGKRVDETYVRRELPVIERRLLEAGFRLAALLNATL
jgi:hypothetical protein